MKKIMTLILAAALCLTALVGCGDNAGTDSNNYDSKTFKVAVVQQLDHSSLNEIRDAIEAELDAAPEGVTVTYENFNGQNDSTVLNQIGSLLCPYFTETPVNCYAAAKKSDTKRYAAYFNGMLKRGIYLAPSQFEAMFVSSVHTQNDLACTVQAAEETLSEMA